MAVVLLLLTVLALWASRFAQISGTNSARLRIGFGQALVLTAAVAYGLTELLSFFGALTPLPTRAAWLVVALGTGGLAWQQRGTLRRSGPGYLPALPRFERYALLAVGLLFLLPLLVLAGWVPPNNHDAMAYHLARVAHWLQHADVAHYPTVYAHQLSQTPLSEFLMLHLHLLSGGDWFDGSVQYVALLGSLVAVTLLIRQFGGGVRVQVLGAVLALTIPMGVFQSTSTQNDLLAGFFLLSFLVEGWRVIHPLPAEGGSPVRRKVAFEPPSAGRGYFFVLLALALGALTKYTVLIFALPFALWFGWRVFRKNGTRAAAKLAGTALLLLTLALGPHWSRNQQTFGNVIGPQPGSALDIPLANQPINAATVYSNTVRNFFNPWGTPLGTWNRAIDGIVNALHSVVSLPVDAPGRNYLDTVYRTEFGYTEDTAGNLPHLLLFVVAGGYLLTRRRVFPGTLPVFFGCIMAGFVLFSALLRYQPWHARLLLPLTLAACVPVGVVLGKFWSERARRVLLVGMLLSAVPWVFFNKAKPLVVVENGARRVLNTPNVLIPETKFRDLLARYPAQARFIENRYRPDTVQRAYRLRDSVSATDRRRLVAFFDSIGFLKRYSVLATSREENYLQNKRSLTEPYRAIADTLARYGIRDVGLDLGFDPTEYPLWAILRIHLGDSLRMRYVRYDPLLATTPHASERFPYRAVVTNFRDVPGKYPPGTVRAYYDFGEVGLLLLRQRP
jgi:hypothetical protein